MTETQTAEQTEKYLKILWISYYVIGALTALYFLFPLIHVALGIFFISNPELFQCEPSSNDCSSEGPSPLFGGWMFIIMGTIFMVIGETLAMTLLITGWLLSKRKRHTLCLITTSLGTFCFPLGTIMGVFTLVLLTKESVKQTFEQSSTKNALTDGA